MTAQPQPNPKNRKNRKEQKSANQLDAISRRFSTQTNPITQPSEAAYYSQLGSPAEAVEPVRGPMQEKATIFAVAKELGSVKGCISVILIFANALYSFWSIRLFGLGRASTKKTIGTRWRITDTGNEFMVAVTKIAFFSFLSYSSFILIYRYKQLKEGGVKSIFLEKISSPRTTVLLQLLMFCLNSVFLLLALKDINASTFFPIMFIALSFLSLLVLVGLAMMAVMKMAGQLRDKKKELKKCSSVCKVVLFFLFMHWMLFALALAIKVHMLQKHLG